MIRGTSPVLLLAACASTSTGGAPAAPPAPPPSPPASHAASAQDEADLRFLSDFVQTRKYTLGKPARPRFLPDGSQVLFLRASARSPVLSLYAFDVATGQTREVVTPAELTRDADETVGPEERARRERMRVTLSGFTAFEIARDGKSVLVTLSGRIYLVPVAGGKGVEVAGPDAEGRSPFDPHLSPDGKHVAFVRGNALWVAPAAGGAAHAVARSSGRDVSVAQAEFVAQEEMDRYSGYWWSPDGAFLAYEQADASPVEKLFVGDPADPRADAGPVPYPRPGHPNVEVGLFVVGAGGGKPTEVTWDRAHHPYLTDVQWDEGGPL